MFVLEFLPEKEIKNIFDKDSRLVIDYLLKKVLFSQPELLSDDKEQNIQMTKEFLEGWVSQALDWKTIGAGNYPIDVYSSKKRIGADVKFLSAKIDKNGNFQNTLSNETSLCQKFKSTGSNLDQLFKRKKKKEILEGWIDILLEKNKIPVSEYNLKDIYYFIFIRGGDSISLAIAKINKNNISRIKISRLTDKSAFIAGYIDERHGNVKIYKSKKRMELRCNPKNLEEDKMLIKWDFKESLKYQTPIKLRGIVRDKIKFNKYILKRAKDFFNL